jgi:agmatine/peptidylarginine deiminase
MKILRLAFFVFLICTLSILAESYADAQESIRPIPPRAAKSWEEVVAERQAAYAEDPARFAAPSFITADRAVIAANEADPVEGLLVEWWCNPFTGPDEADLLWMFAISTALWTGAEAYVYLNTWAPYPGDLLETCSQMLQDTFGIPPEFVHWYLDFASDSFWLRDFGPLFVRDIEDGALSIEDAKYYPYRFNDDAMPTDFAARIGVPVSDFDLYFEGGNFLPNGGGICLTSSVVLDANPHVDKESIEEMFRTQLGCVELVIVEALKDYATGHVDMWMAWADHTTLLVGEYLPTQDAVNREIIERNVRKKLRGLHDPETGEPIEIVRIPMPTNCPSEDRPGQRPDLESPPLASQSCAHIPARDRIWRNYLNVLFINNVLLLPTYAQDRTHESEAIATWSSFGFNVIPLDADLIVPSQGAFHCVAKTLDAPW